jgi:hypothetical protein
MSNRAGVIEHTRPDVVAAFDGRAALYADPQRLSLPLLHRDSRGRSRPRRALLPMDYGSEHLSKPAEK